MRCALTLRAGLAAALLLGAAPAAALQINFEATDLADVVAGQDLWQYSYTVSGASFNAGQGFTLYFDYTLYTDLDSTPTPPNADWDVISIQPDLGLPDDGFYDALALADGASLADPFVVTFVWLGGGTPGEQPAEMYEDTGSGFSVVEESASVPVPEPAPLAFAALALALVGVGRARRFRRAALVGLSALALASCGPKVYEVDLGQGAVLRYWQVAKKRVSRTEFEYSFAGSLESPVPGLQLVFFDAPSQGTKLIDDDFAFMITDPNIEALADDLIVMRHNRLLPFNPIFDVSWLFEDCHDVDPKPDADDFYAAAKVSLPGLSHAWNDAGEFQRLLNRMARELGCVLDPADLPEPQPGPCITSDCRTECRNTLCCDVQYCGPTDSMDEYGETGTFGGTPTSEHLNAVCRAHDECVFESCVSDVPPCWFSDQSLPCDNPLLLACETLPDGPFRLFDERYCAIATALREQEDDPACSEAPCSGDGCPECNPETGHCDLGVAPPPDPGVKLCTVPIPGENPYCLEDALLALVPSGSVGPPIAAGAGLVVLLALARRRLRG